MTGPTRGSDQVGGHLNSAKNTRPYREGNEVRKLSGSENFSPKSLGHRKFPLRFLENP